MSSVWKYYDNIPLEGKALCKLCLAKNPKAKDPKKISYKGGSTKGLWDHLKSIHPKDYHKEKILKPVEPDEEPTQVGLNTSFV